MLYFGDDKKLHCDAQEVEKIRLMDDSDGRIIRKYATHSLR